GLFAMPNPLFDGGATEDRKWRQPAVLTVADWRVDFLLANVPSFIIFNKQGENPEVLYLVPVDNKEMGDKNKEAMDKRRSAKKRTSQLQKLLEQLQQMQGMRGGPMGGPMGGAMGGAGGPMMGRMGGGPGGAGGPPGMAGNPMMAQMQQA